MASSRPSTMVIVSPGLPWAWTQHQNWYRPSGLMPEAEQNLWSPGVTGSPTTPLPREIVCLVPSTTMSVVVLPTLSFVSVASSFTNPFLMDPFPPRTSATSSVTVQVNASPEAVHLPITFSAPSRAVALRSTPLKPFGICKPSPRPTEKVAPFSTLSPS